MLYSYNHVYVITIEVLNKKRYKQEIKVIDLRTLVVALCVGSNPPACVRNFSCYISIVTYTYRLNVMSISKIYQQFNSVLP